MLTRDGSLLVLADGERETPTLRWQARVGEAQLGERLLRLAAAEEHTLSAELAFGRELARAALSELAATSPRETMPITPPADVVACLLSRAPETLRRGLGERAVRTAWREICVVVHRQLAHPGVTRDAFLRGHGVDPDRDRIYLHVAERKHDPARPFAFLVTVARGLGAHGRVQHITLAAALRQHADDPQARQRLLAPLRASPGCGCSCASASVVASPTTWASARPSRSAPSCSS